MLQLRPTCEHCNCALNPSSSDAMICSFECTFCRNCVDEYFGNVCPNCGGNLTPRPNRPAKDWRSGNYLGNWPAQTEIIHREKDVDAHQKFRDKLDAIDPQDR